jgi:hypothetical protein
MSTRRKAKSKNRRDKIADNLVTTFMKGFREHAAEARFFLLVSSLQYELARNRNPRDTSLEKFRAAQKDLEQMLQSKEWEVAVKFIRELNGTLDIYIENSEAAIESRLTSYWEQLSGFGVGVASDTVWIPEPRMYYLLVWED